MACCSIGNEFVRRYDSIECRLEQRRRRLHQLSRVVDRVSTPARSTDAVRTQDSSQRPRLALSTSRRGLPVDCRARRRRVRATTPTDAATALRPTGRATPVATDRCLCAAGARRCPAGISQELSAIQRGEVELITPWLRHGASIRC